jgi:dienelactone hydrolase
MMKRRVRQGLVLALAGAGSMAMSAAAWAADAPAAAAPKDAEAIARAFGARVAVSSMSMSPDGNKVAFIVPEGSGQKVMVADLVAGGTPVAIVASNRTGETLRSCNWPTNTRLFCRVSVYAANAGTPIMYMRMVAVDADGKHAQVVSQMTTGRELGFDVGGDRVLDWNGTKPGQVLMTRMFVPQNTIGTRLANDDKGLAVEAVDVDTMQRRVVERARMGVAGYVSDGIGHVRLMAQSVENATDYDTGKAIWYYRRAGATDWQKLGKVDASDGIGLKGFVPEAVDPTLDVVYGFDTAPNGRKAVYRVKLDGSMQRELVIGRDDVDVDDLLTIGRNERVVGVSYATDVRRVAFFDPQLEKLAVALHGALPGAPQIDFVDSSSDEKRLLLLAGGDTDPGMYYVFDKSTHKLEQVLAQRPELAGITLSPMKSVSYPAADGTMIPAYLTLPAGSSGKGLPAIVMPHGGPSSRDEWGFDWLVQYFATRGYAVLQPNYRGSSGFGSNWLNGNAFHNWSTAIGDVDDAGRWLVKQGIAAPGKLAIVGWSYGGYAALQSGVVDPGLYKAIVAIAPVTDLGRLRDDAMKYTNGGIVDKQIGHGDEIIRQGSPAQNSAKIVAPVMLFHGDADLNVPVDQSRLMADRLKASGHLAGYTEYPGLDHQLENGVARAQMLFKSDQFIRTTLGL